MDGCRVVGSRARCRAGQGRTEQTKAEHGRAGSGRAGPGRVGPGRAALPCPALPGPAPPRPAPPRPPGPAPPGPAPPRAPPPAPRPPAPPRPAPPRPALPCLCSACPALPPCPGRGRAARPYCLTAKKLLAGRRHYSPRVPQSFTLPHRAVGTLGRGPRSEPLGSLGFRVWGLGFRVEGFAVSGWFSAFGGEGFCCFGELRFFRGFRLFIWV